MIKLKSLLKNFLKENGEYRGEHEAPDKTSGSPMFNLTGIYPEDIYSSEAARYYGDNGGDGNDHFSVSIIQSARNKPRAQIKVYRAIPYMPSNDQKIIDYENEKRYIQKYGKIPGANTKLNPSRYYEYISNEIERLRSLPPVESKKIRINPGDWVTINRSYAKEHGESNLKGKYKILSKVVPAKFLYTTGDSLHEWGYDPT